MKQFQAGKITEISQEKIKKLMELLEQNGRAEQVAALHEALQGTRAEDKIRIAFVGQYSSGKSSIISALTGNRQIEIGSDVTTQNVADYRWGNFLLSDTPGLHDNETHDKIAAEAIQNSDLIVYCITSELFAQNTRDDYVNLVYEKDYAGKVILVINKLNSEATEDRDQLIQNYIDSINAAIAPHTIDDVKYAFFDVKDYLKGVATGNEGRVQYSNFETFIALLNDFLQEKGLLFKLTTPLYVAKNVIDQAFVGGADDLVDRTHRDILARLEKKVNRLRGRAAQKWDGIVLEHYVGFAEKAYALLDQTVDQNFDFAAAVEVLRSNTQNELISCLDAMVAEEQAMLSEELESILNSKQAQYVVNYGQSGSEDGAQINHPGGQNRGNTAKQNKAIKGTVDRALGVAAKKVGDNSYKIVEKVGHAIGVKFKPWGIVKASQKLAKACKFLGPITEAISLGMDIWEACKDKQAAKEYMNAVANVRREIDQYKVEQISAWQKEKTDFLTEVYTDVIEQIAQEKQNILSNQKKDEAFNRGLAALSQELEELIQAALTGSTDHLTAE